MNATKDRDLPAHAAAADQLRIILAKVGISGRELARRIGVSPNWVSLRTTGQQAITAEDAELITEVLGVSLSDLAGIPSPPARRRLASVLSDIQDFIDGERRTPDGRPIRPTDAEKQFVLKSCRHLLNMAIEVHQPPIREPQMRRRGG